MDNWTELYVWFGWWPEEKNKLLREANVITGSSHSRLLRDKKLAMQTAQQYVKGEVFNSDSAIKGWLLSIALVASVSKKKWPLYTHLKTSNMHM